MGSHSHRQTGRPSLVERSSRSPTARFPNHPAGSFNYPHLPNLPRLALFTLEKQREYQLTGDAPHQRERDEQITKLRYSLHKKPEDGLRYSLDKKPDDPSTADAVVEFVPVDFADKTSEGDTLKPFKEVSGEKSASEDSVGGKITDAEEGAAVAQLAVNVGKSGRINKLNFTPVDLSTGWANKTGLVQQILSNDIPALDLVPGADMFFNSTSDEFISFLPVEVTRRKEEDERKGEGADEAVDGGGEHERGGDSGDDHREEPGEEAEEEGEEGEGEAEGGEAEEAEEEDEERELSPASGRLPCVQLAEKLHEEEILQQGASEADPGALARGKEELALLSDSCFLQQRGISRGKTNKKK